MILQAVMALPRQLNMPISLGIQRRGATQYMSSSFKLSPAQSDHVWAFLFCICCKTRRCCARTPGGSLREDGPSRIDIKRRCTSNVIESVALPDSAALALIREASDRLHLSARGFHRILKLARTIADLDGAEKVESLHLSEALTYRVDTTRQLRAA